MTKSLYDKMKGENMFLRNKKDNYPVPLRGIKI